MRLAIDFVELNLNPAHMAHGIDLVHDMRRRWDHGGVEDQMESALLTVLLLRELNRKHSGIGDVLRQALADERGDSNVTIGEPSKSE